MPLLGTERRSRLLDALARDGAIRLETAAAELGVSVMTVRRDLQSLEQEGLARRVRGGAVAPLRPEAFDTRAGTRAGAKRVIAAKALGLVPQEGAAAFDASTTSGAVLALIEARDLVVATNSLDNAATARRRPGVRSVLVGGELEERTGSFVGPVADLAARSMSYGVLMSSASGVDPSLGPSEVSLAEAQTKASFRAHADRVVLLADSAKLGLRALARWVEWSEVDVLVTELDPDDARLEPYRGVVELR